MRVSQKGSRDPYSILGHGSGWVMCWRGNVDVRLNQQNPDQEVFQILSHQFLLAIPDLRDYIDQAATGVTDKRQDPDEADRRSGNATLLSAGHRYTEEIDFRKIVLRLTNGVRWGIGIKCERTCTDETCKRTPRCSGPAFYRECRFFDAKPHWEVHTRTKEYLDTLPESERVRLLLPDVSAILTPRHRRATRLLATAPTTSTSRFPSSPARTGCRTTPCGRQAARRPATRRPTTSTLRRWRGRTSGRGCASSTAP